MLKLIAAVDSEDEGLLLRRKLRPALFGTDGLQLVTVLPPALATSWDGDAVAALISTSSFRAPHRGAFRTLRDAGFEGPILVIAKLDSPKFLEELQRAPNAHFLEKPFDTRDLLGLVSKFVQDMRVQQRIHRRFPTEELAEVEIDGVSTRTIIRNLSRGGACLEVDEGALPERGSRVVLKIALRDVDRSYALPAKVVWVTTMGLEGRPGVGVEFTGAQASV